MNMSKDVKKSIRCQRCQTNCKLYFICHKMSNVKKSNTLTVDDLKEMSNVKKSKRCQQTVNLYEVAWGGRDEVACGGRDEVACGGRGEVAFSGRVKWPWVGGVRWPGMGGVR